MIVQISYPSEEYVIPSCFISSLLLGTWSPFWQVYSSRHGDFSTHFPNDEGNWETFQCILVIWTSFLWSVGVVCPFLIDPFFPILLICAVVCVCVYLLLYSSHFMTSCGVLWLTEILKGKYFISLPHGEHILYHVYEISVYHQCHKNTFFVKLLCFTFYIYNLSRIAFINSGRQGIKIFFFTLCICLVNPAKFIAKNVTWAPTQQDHFL